MKAPRVCIIRRAYYPAESHVRRNAETLAASGYEVDLICLRDRGEPAREVVAGVHVHRLPLRAHRGGVGGYIAEYLAFFLLAFASVSWLQLRRRYALIEADSMPDFLAFAALVPRLAGARLVLYLFESMPEIWAQKQGLPMSHWAIRLLRWQEVVSCRFANVVLCCHGMARRALIEHGVPARKTVTILNVPDEQLFHLHPEAPPAEDGKFHLVQHGTITENYGVQVALQALARLDPALPVHYDVIGEGEYRPALESLARDLGVQDRVTFHGFVSRERLLELLLRANAGLVPMLFEYQSPNKLFDFVALGKPVIASDRKTFGQHFSTDEVLYFATGDAGALASAIEHALRHPCEMQAQAERASRRYQRYRWATMQKRYTGVYNRLAAARAGE